MSQQARQQRAEEIELSEQTAVPADGIVLGGIEGVRHRFKSSDETVRIGALQTALNYGDAGLDLVITALEDKSLGVSWAAYKLLEARNERSVKEVLRRYGLTHSYEVVTVNVWGEIVGREVKRTRIFRERVESTVLYLVAIPEGRFIMGSSDSEKDRWDREGPQHEVNVAGFWMGQYAVTQSQYEAVMGKNPSRFKSAYRPVERVSWYDAVEFCNRLSAQTGRQYRLPSEAEWEYACRAGTTTPFHYGETLSSELANYAGHYPYQSEAKRRSRRETTEVGQFPPNGYGLYDMHGNVWEWCLDHWHDNYEGAPTDGSAWVTGGDSGFRVKRGGSWFYDPRLYRSACRVYYDPGYGSYYVGFRVVCEVPKSLQ